ncbi:DUF2712 domain-containing protein [Enterococcus columbae]|uniref:Uncharacterized protein n=1 Tax=Enterococcus columbae DSM 7374 = ATCC 51263 TaxID=1121865 RepID=S0KPF3_9ENTE|nr:DUF2712 domain-containing protein [Enterococcus columbae]EOT41953.1 hypothetical protein OMW_01067 [Enterococcus columbae DSM 7374 = ATCC 51263]EOW80510.1 hypothetical protein I568_01687 [Enterococcus columbae DSM 7374 = ATCC 51263]OJG26414.1 hypothetical protein RR47_GL000162 [Enterococcus columbae DSM 7374 = ATCC 51263]
MIKKVLLAGAASVLLLAGSIPVLANNHADTSWSFWLKANQGNSYTASREKTDASSAYLALHSMSKSGGVNGWLQMANGTEIGSPKTRVYSGGAAYVINYAYEKYGHSNVRMAIETANSFSTSTQASGVWSPDSV